MFRVFPAPAGINRGLFNCVERLNCVPRASGDKPTAWIEGRVFGPCSPRQRG